MMQKQLTFIFSENEIDCAVSKIQNLMYLKNGFA